MAGFSDPTPPERPKVIGRSELQAYEPISTVVSKLSNPWMARA